MNSKGFTLIELLLTITILGLVITIAIPSYTGISRVIKENQRNNVINKIEIAASKYAFDTGETIIFVDKLVTEGYIDSDDEEGNIKDPLTSERMNCYIIEMKKESDYYSATFKDEKNYDNNGECDLNKLEEKSEEVSIQVLNNGEIIDSTDDWISGSISLKPHSNNTVILNCASNKCMWTSSSGAYYEDKTGDGINLNVKGLLETKYTFQYTVYDTNSEKVTRYTTSKNFKIDNESPSIYTNQITVTDRFTSTSSKKVKIVASDGKGSGIFGYFMKISDGTTCNSTSIASSYQTSNTFTVTQNGNYLICVKDKVGNVSTSSLSISNIS